MWYVILDQSGEAKQQHFESREELVDHIVGGLGMKRIGHNQWARGAKRRIILAEFKEWSDAHIMVSEISATASRLAEGSYRA